MYAGALDVLHDSGHENILSVADRIDLELLAGDVFVNEYRAVRIDRNRIAEISSQAVFVCDDLHRASAEHEARAHKNRIAYARGTGYPISCAARTPSSTFVTALPFGCGIPSFSMTFSN